jgi:hypothetical protein
MPHLKKKTMNYKLVVLGTWSQMAAVMQGK